MNEDIAVHEQLESVPFHEDAFELSVAVQARHQIRRIPFPAPQVSKHLHGLQVCEGCVEEFCRFLIKSFTRQDIAELRGIVVSLCL